MKAKRFLSSTLLLMLCLSTLNQQPELYNQPEERSIERARNPELMKQLRQQEVEPRQVAKQQPKDR